MGEHELILKAKEMRTVEVTCPICRCGVIFDASSDQKAPSLCPSCGSEDKEMQKWLAGYRQWYQAIVTSQKQFKFRVPING